jgi:putative acetyltransferase
MSTAAIVEATSPEHLEVIRTLFLEYAASLAFSLEYQGFEHELATLPGRYGPPNGCLLLAISAGGGVGSAALREIEPSPAGRTCEMKRLYVRPSHRGQGLGRRLAQEIIDRGRALGYAAMRLDTGDDMIPARRLYESLGFRPIERYNDDPMENTLWFELRY